MAASETAPARPASSVVSGLPQADHLQTAVTQGGGAYAIPRRTPAYIETPVP
ncbi:MAG: hypothetical protein OXF60_09290 [Gammaproteobacteria bacterium]|nr:hypothetical protein [Gammaproteobacteria bacterium]